MLLENLVTRRVSEENASKSSLTRRVTKQGHLLLAAVASQRQVIGDLDPKRKRGNGLRKSLAHPIKRVFCSTAAERRRTFRAVCKARSIDMLAQVQSAAADLTIFFEVSAYFLCALRNRYEFEEHADR